MEIMDLNLSFHIVIPICIDQHRKYLSILIFSLDIHNINKDVVHSQNSLIQDITGISSTETVFLRGSFIALTLICDKRSCQILIAFKKLLVRFVLIWNKATRQHCNKFLLLRADRYAFSLSNFLQIIALKFFRCNQVALSM